MSRSASRRDFLRRVSKWTAAGLVSTAVPPAAARAARSSQSKIKVGQIGTSHAHATKLEVYRQSSDYEVVGIVEPDEALREQAQKKSAFRDLPWMTEEQLLNQPGLQAVLVETEVRDLLNAAEHAVAAGKHVHLDKPAGQSFSQYRRLLASAEQQKLLVQMGYMFRYSPAVVLLRQMLNDGWLGEVFEIQAVMSKVLPLGDRKDLAQYPGGMMFELGPHLIDMLIAIMGRPDSIKSFARHSAAIDDNLVDNMLAVCEYPKAIATIKSSAEEVEGGSRRQFVVCGTSGTFEIQPLEPPKVRLSLDRKRGEYRRGSQAVDVGPYQRYVADAADMARIIRGEKGSDFSYAHDLTVQETILRASGLSLDS
jgi:predicted dehydrogenase